MSEDKTNKPGFLKRWFKKDKASQEPLEAEISAESPEAPAQPSSIEAPATCEPAVEGHVEESAEIADEKAGLFRLKTGLQKTRKGFLRSLDQVFLGKKQLDDEMVTRLEEVLVTADIGVKTAYELLENVTDRVKRRELDDPEAVISHLKALIKGILSNVEAPLRVGYGSGPFVVMVLGVNGSGKTTTIAKIAGRYQSAGRKVILAAGDTFRAAAVEQLQIWADRIGCTVVKGKEKADPSSVAFEAMERALEENADLVLVDTAGRLHTRVPLMEELKKVSRTLAKKIPDAPHETLLVIDASMGQNAILQARTFNEAVPVTGIALTKLDGTSKGGVVVGISNELKIPVRYIGIGEKMDDLREFSANDFVEALFAEPGSARETW
jgi:fused signal recognition particle receptor